MRFILQVEAAPASATQSQSQSQSPVVLALTPRVADLVRVFGRESALLPADALDPRGVMRRDILASSQPCAGIVDELWIVVLLHFVEVVLDLAHLLLALCTLLLPWRALELLCAVSETDKRAAWREAQELHEDHCDAKLCLQDYKAGMAPLMNSLSKQPQSAQDYYTRHYMYYYYYHHAPAAVTSRLKDLERRTWRSYEACMGRVLKQASKGSAAVQALGEALQEGRLVEERLLRHWALRTAFNTLRPEDEDKWRVIAGRPLEVGDERGGTAALLVQVVEAAEAQESKARRTADELVQSRLVRESLTRGASATSSSSSSSSSLPPRVMAQSVPSLPLLLHCFDVT